jgi:hypothetical protein
MAQTAAHLADHVIPPVPVRQWVISVPKRLPGFLADRRRAVAALTKIFLDEIERSLLTTSGVTAAADTPSASRPRLGGISFLHRFGSALLRYCARPPFALERLSVTRDASGRIARVRYVLPRHKVANWVGPGRGQKTTRPGAGGGVELAPFEFLDRLADLVPPPRKHRHRYHGVFAPNHKLRRAVTALAKRQRRQAARGRNGRAWERRSSHRRLLRRESKAPLTRHLTDCVG